VCLYPKVSVTTKDFVSISTLRKGHRLHDGEQSLYPTRKDIPIYLAFAFLYLSASSSLFMGIAGEAVWSRVPSSDLFNELFVCKGTIQCRCHSI